MYLFIFYDVVDWSEKASSRLICCCREEHSTAISLISLNSEWRITFHWKSSQALRKPWGRSRCWRFKDLNGSPTRCIKSYKMYLLISFVVIHPISCHWKGSTTCCHSLLSTVLFTSELMSYNLKNQDQRWVSKVWDTSWLNCLLTVLCTSARTVDDTVEIILTFSHTISIV